MEWSGVESSRENGGIDGWMDGHMDGWINYIAG